MTRHVVLVSPFTQTCPLPNSPLTPGPRRPTISATARAMSAMRKAYCTVETPRSQLVRSSNAAYAPRTDHAARVSSSVTPPLPSPILVHRLPVWSYLAFPRESPISQELSCVAPAHIGRIPGTERFET